ncbi:putative hydroxypyruvate isomerase YgbM [compost metagenome]
MPKFCANLSFFWSELDFMDRFAAAAKAGFKGVEYLFPYDHDKSRIAAELNKHCLL